MATTIYITANQLQPTTNGIPFKYILMKVAINSTMKPRDELIWFDLVNLPIAPLMDGKGWVFNGTQTSII